MKTNFYFFKVLVLCFLFATGCKLGAGDYSDSLTLDGQSENIPPTIEEPAPPPPPQPQNPPDPQDPPSPIDPVAATHPSNGFSHMALDHKTVVVTFKDEANIDFASITKNSISFTPAATVSSVTKDAVNHKVTFHMQSFWKPNKNYHATLSSIQSLDQIPLTEHKWSFKTMTADDYWEPMHEKLAQYILSTSNDPNLFIPNTDGVKTAWHKWMKDIYSPDQIDGSNLNDFLQFLIEADFVLADKVEHAGAWSNLANNNLHYSLDHKDPAALKNFKEKLGQLLEYTKESRSHMKEAAKIYSVILEKVPEIGFFEQHPFKQYAVQFALTVTNKVAATFTGGDSTAEVLVANLGASAELFKALISVSFKFKGDFYSFIQFDQDPDEFCFESCGPTQTYPLKRGRYGAYSSPIVIFTYFK